MICQARGVGSTGVHGCRCVTGRNRWEAIRMVGLMVIVSVDRGAGRG